MSRDLVTIAKNLRTVLIPINWEFKQQDAALRNWDLWGPLVRCGGPLNCFCLYRS